MKLSHSPHEKTTKVFKCGNSWAVRIPNEFHFENREVKISRKKNGDLLIREIPKTLACVCETLAKIPKNMFNPREPEPKLEEREKF